MGWDDMDGCTPPLIGHMSALKYLKKKKKTNRYNEMNKPKCVVARAPRVGGWAWLCVNNETFI